MDGLRHFTSNANVVVNFLQSINCLLYQLRWLEGQIRHAPNEQIAIVLVLVGLLGYYTFVCNGETNEENGYFCGENGVSGLIACAVLSVIAFFFYKRFHDRNPTVTIAERVESDEQEKFLGASVPPFEQIELGQPIRMPPRNGVVRPAAYV